MAGTLNKVMLIGNLGDEVKMHYFDDKNCVGRFPIATSESYVSKQTNERITNTEWHNIVVRNKAAEICEKYLSKGDKVYIEGRIKTRKWTDDKGMERYSTEIQCDEFTFLTPKTEQQVQKPTMPSSNPKPQSSAPTNTEPEVDDDLPF
ncbi:single-stranded DNA-binding protein [Winogradskyella endarachnes]|uniref:Single-stranded DNA-binding protein n=1 Tax=Winogradskyella endarachnes TaxID=2681965 RepID=A0A6L6UAK2_9FLAO|nr:single-stranded DNA-binding protein [Winogradskyella endarachnes]MUU78546.1 single-stranded DNA-binding protein [Winogradskyella endarachnes]